MEASTGEEKAELQNKRQEKINAYGQRVTDFLNEYLSAYEITGGLSKSQANQVWYLYKIYDDNGNADMYNTMSAGEYYSNKAETYSNRQATNLAAKSGLDQFIDPNVVQADDLAKKAYAPTSSYYESYGRRAFMNSVYGDSAKNIYRIEKALNNANINRKDMFAGYYSAENKTQKKQAKADWNAKVVNVLAPIVEEVGLDTILEDRKTLDYLDEFIFVDNPFKTKDYIKAIFGGQ